jgi:hypothetical protein
MSISAQVLAAVMNLMNVETRDECVKLELPAEVAMTRHQEGWDFDPNFEISLGILNGQDIRAAQLLLPETRDTQRRWTSGGKYSEELSFGLMISTQCRRSFR